MTARDNGTPKFETVRYEPKGPICHIVLNRPEKLNAANDQLVEEVNDALFEFDADSTLQVAILSGAGRAFCSGADVASWLEPATDVPAAFPVPSSRLLERCSASAAPPFAPEPFAARAPRCFGQRHNEGSDDCF